MKALHPERILARLFFGRFFESELMPGGPQARLVIWSVALLGTPGFMMAVLAGRNYIHIASQSRSALMEAVMRAQLLYGTYSMIVLGFVGLVMWEAVFPDRRDVRTLGVLPLSTRTHVVGRLAALGAVGALFAVGVNLESAVAYALVLWAHDVAFGFVRPAAAHLTATVLAGLFTFSLVVVVQGVLLNVFGRKIAQRLALVFQAAAVVVLIEAIPFVQEVGKHIGEARRSGVSADGGILLLPPVWFLALNQVLAGTIRFVPADRAVAAVAGTAVVIGAATLLIAGAYGRLVQQAMEGQAAPSGRRWGLERVFHALGGIVSRHPIERALLGFTLMTLARSRVHLTMLATYLGVAVAIIAPTVIPLFVTRNPQAELAAPNVALLSVPLVLYFWTLCAMRALFGIPREIKANWIFRLHARDDRMHRVVGGVRAALVIAVVVPVATMAGSAGTALWGAPRGAAHAAFTLAAGMLLADVMLWGLRKIPFACTYFPGRSRAATHWPFYLIAFTSYSYGTAGLELTALSNPLLLGGLLAGMAGLSVGILHLRRRTLRPPPGLTYEETDPDATFGGFNLSEGLAADRSAARS